MTNEKMGRVGFTIEGLDSDDRLVVPCGDLDVVIQHNSDGIEVSVFPLAVTDEPYETRNIKFSDVPTAENHGVFWGFNESMVKYYEKSIHNSETVMVIVNNVRIEIFNSDDGVNITVQDNRTLDYVKGVDGIFVEFGRNPTTTETKIITIPQLPESELNDLIETILHLSNSSSMSIEPEEFSKTIIDEIFEKYNIIIDG